MKTARLILSLTITLALIFSAGVFSATVSRADGIDDTEIADAPEAVVISNNLTAIYRMNNTLTGEHLYTGDVNEVNDLAKDQTWENEGIFWYAPNTGTPVYRLYLPGAFHLYTTDENEVNELTSNGGWLKDNDGKPLFYSGGSIEIYRLYNNASMQHLLTSDKNEYDTLSASPDWSGEGVKLMAEAIGDRNGVFNHEDRAGTYINAVEEEIEGETNVNLNYLVLKTDGTGYWFVQDDIPITEWNEASFTAGGVSYAYTYGEDSSITVTDSGDIYNYSASGLPEELAARMK